MVIDEVGGSHTGVLVDHKDHKVRWMKIVSPSTRASENEEHVCECESSSLLWSGSVCVGQCVNEGRRQRSKTPIFQVAK